MIRLFGAFLLAVVVLAVGAPVGALAQDRDTPVSSEAGVTAGELAQSPAAERPVYSAIEAAQVTQAGPPRTLRAYWHVFIAFAVTWLLLFGYALSLGRRWAALERQLQQDLSQR